MPLVGVHCSPTQNEPLQCIDRMSAFRAPPRSPERRDDGAKQPFAKPRGHNHEQAGHWRIYRAFILPQISIVRCLRPSTESPARAAAIDQWRLSASRMASTMWEREVSPPHMRDEGSVQLLGRGKLTYRWQTCRCHHALQRNARESAMTMCCQYSACSDDHSPAEIQLGRTTTLRPHACVAPASRAPSARCRPGSARQR